MLLPACFSDRNSGKAPPHKKTLQTPLPDKFSRIQSRMPDIPESFFHINLYPLQFDEFLSATGQEWYGEVIRGHFKTAPGKASLLHFQKVSWSRLSGSGGTGTFGSPCQAGRATRGVPATFSVPPPPCGFSDRY